MFGKNNFSGFLGKGYGQKLIGEGKGLVHPQDNLNNQVRSLVSVPEVKKSYGSLEKKH